MIKLRSVGYFIVLFFSASYSGVQAQSASNQGDALKIIPVNLADTSFADLKPLAAMIGGSRIVYLGEPNHYAGNIFEAKTHIVKYLHEVLGFDFLAFESGFYDLAKAQADIDAGKDVSTALYRSIFSIWTATNEFQPMMEYIDKQKKSIKLLGFDSQFSREYMFEDLHDDISELILGAKPVIVEGELEYWEEVVEEMAENYRVSKEFNLTIFKVVHGRIRSAVSNHMDLNKREFMLRVLDNILEMAQDYHRNDPGSKTRKTWIASDSNVRDRLMAENLIFWAKKNPSSKIICWGANAHFANRVSSLDNEELKGFKPMGNHIKQALGEDQVFTVFFTGVESDSTNDTRSIENTWLSQGNTGYVDLKGNKFFFSQSLETESSAIKGDWSQVCDAMFFVGKYEATTPASVILKVEEEEQLEVEGLQKQVDAASLAQSDEKYQVRQQGGNQEIRISGRIVDELTKRPIVYANIAIVKKQLGTSSSTTGDYTLFVLTDCLNDSARISYIGYKPKVLSVRELINKPQISLTPGSELQEVTILAKKPDARLIMKKAIKAIEKNYNQEAFTQQMYVRYKVHRDSSSVILDCLHEVYDDNGFQKSWLYMGGYDGFFKVLGARSSKCDSSFRPVAPFQAYNNTNHVWVLRRYENSVNYRNNNFLSLTLLRKYDFQLMGTRVEDGEEQYIIAFRCKRPSHRRTTSIAPLEFNGELFINKSDLAFTRINTYAVMDKNELDFIFDRQVYKTNEMMFDWKTVEYKKIGKFYYLDKSTSFSNWEMPVWSDNEVRSIWVKEGKQAKQESSYIPDGLPYRPEDFKLLDSK